MPPWLWKHPYEAKELGWPQLSAAASLANFASARYFYGGHSRFLGCFTCTFVKQSSVDVGPWVSCGISYGMIGYFIWIDASIKDIAWIEMDRWCFRVVPPTVKHTTIATSGLARLGLADDGASKAFVGGLTCGGAPCCTFGCPQYGCVWKCELNVIYPQMAMWMAIISKWI